MTPPAPNDALLVRLDAVSRSFGAIKAVDDVSFGVAPGEVHALCGHNGAGKSTVVKMLTGLLRPDSGRILMEGEAVELRSPQEAQAHRVALVDQELSVVPALSVMDNILLGGLREPFLQRPAAQRLRTRALLDEIGLRDVDPRDRLEDLSIGQRQLVEIARALGRDARLLILDEPTATLSSHEIEHVFAAIRRVAAAGRSVIYVSHRLDEVMDLCQRVTVMRDGRLVATADTADITAQELVTMMLGDLPASAPPARPPAGAQAMELSIAGLCAGQKTRDFALTTTGGRVYALAGQVGSGASDVLRAVAGLAPEARGQVDVDGRRLPLGAPGQSVAAGVAYLSNDRKGEGLFLGQSATANLVSTRLKALGHWGIVRGADVKRAAADLAETIGLAPARLPAPVSELSGGNQQKVLLGRCLERADTKVLLLDEPTRGVDVKGRAEIHALVRGVAAGGATVVFASTELDEILDLADVVVTMRAGAIVAVRERADVTARSILDEMTHAVVQEDAA